MSIGPVSGERGVVARNGDMHSHFVHGENGRVWWHVQCGSRAALIDEDVSRLGPPAGERTLHPVR